MRKSTMVELVIELEKLSPSEAKDKMILEAKSGSFHDYKSMALCGKMHFVKCAQWCRRRMNDQDIEIIDRLDKEIQDGVYDEVADKEDRESMARDIDENTKNKAEADKLKELLGLNKQPPSKWGNKFFN